MSQQARSMPTLGEIGQFVMELASLIGIGLIGWNLGEKRWPGAVLALVLIMLTGTIWGRFRTPGFVPTGRPPTFPVSGPIRIAIELMVYAIGIFGVWYSGREQTAFLLVGIAVLTLILSRERYVALWSTRV